jgi:flagellar basal body-associated protein FliL
METQINTGTPQHEDNSSMAIVAVIAIVILVVVLFLLFGRGMFSGDTNNQTQTETPNETATDSAR